MGSVTHLVTKYLPHPVYSKMRYARDFMLDVVDVATGRRQDLTPPRRLITIGGGPFLQIGREFLEHFIKLGRLKPDSRVLEVGCGCGRMAVPMTGYLSAKGRYEGFDIHRPYIDWATRRITSRFPNFRFQVSDIYNKQYNPGGRIKSTDFKFPFPDQSFDLVILTSVFTHMLPTDIAHYLREISRVLVKDGLCFATFFIINPASQTLVAAGKSSEKLTLPYGECFVMDVATPEFAIGYMEANVRAMTSQAGLAIEDPIHYGKWSGRTDYVDYQDIVVARRI